MGVAFVRSSSRVCVLRGLLVPACESVACGVDLVVLIRKQCELTDRLICLELGTVTEHVDMKPLAF